jgi:hypothetical protein
MKKWMVSSLTALGACVWITVFVWIRYGRWEAFTVLQAMVFLASIIEIPIYKCLADRERESDERGRS